MQECLGIYIENNLIKYAKVSKDKTDYKIEAHGIKFFENEQDAIKKTIEETYSFGTPISINAANESYVYYDIFSLLSKKDVQKTVQTEYEAYCDENKYNPNTFETRYALVQNIENKEKIRAIQVLINKIELNKQKQNIEQHNLTRIVPIGAAIASIVKLDKKENALVVNMEEKTTITTIYDRQVYNVETLDIGSQEVLEKINKTENSISKAYEICKDTTIYTSNVIEGTNEQPYLEYIIPNLYKICQRLQQIVESSPEKINTIYLTGTLAVVNNVDLYFQEFFSSVECKVLRPSILTGNVTQINVKDYIEVNSAISLAIQGLGDGIEALNFKKAGVGDKLKQLGTVQIGSGKKGKSNSSGKEHKQIDFSFKGALDKTEIILTRCVIAIILINIIFITFSKMLYKQQDNKQKEVETLISQEKSEINKINNDINSLNSKNTAYVALTEKLDAIDKKINRIERRKNAIPNLLNQIMYIIPETVQLVSIKSATVDENSDSEQEKITIVAQAYDYDQLGYFIARIKLEGYLKNVISSSGQKNGEIVSVTIEGELP